MVDLRRRWIFDGLEESWRWLDGALFEGEVYSPQLVLVGSNVLGWSIGLNWWNGLEWWMDCGLTVGGGGHPSCPI